MVSPLIGRIIDRLGTGWVLTVSSLVVGICAIRLSLVAGPLAFYATYVIGRMTFAGPLDLAPATAVSNWFVRRRAIMLAFVHASRGAGLGLLPFVAQTVINGWGWRTSWAVLGILVLAVGVFPPALLMVRRPEDVGLLPDGARSPGVKTAVEPDVAGKLEHDFALAEALRTPAMWLVMAFSALIFMVQAGVSLHQAPYYIQKGLSPTEAASVVTVFAFSSAIGGLLWSSLVAQMSVRFVVAAAAGAMFFGVLFIIKADVVPTAYIAAAVFGGGFGGVSALLQLVWADYYGRHSLGAIRGVALPVQLAGQAVGPILAGSLFDSTGSYVRSFTIFAVSAAVAAGIVALARPPKLRRRD